MGWFLYVYFVNFSIWLFVEEAFFALPFPRRKYFWPRLIGSLAVYFTVGYGYVELVKLVPDEFYFLASTCYYLSLFAASLGMMKFCFAVDWKEVLFAGTAGYAVQHITYALSCVIRSATGLSGLGLTMIEILGMRYYDLPLYVATGLLCYFLLVRQHQRHGSLKRVDFRMSLISLAILCCSVALSQLVHGWSGADGSAHRVVCWLYAIISCLLGLFLQFDIAKRNRAEADRELLEQILAREQQKQALTKESIDMINMKCHDLKYQVTALEQMENPAQRRETIAQLKESVMIYDNVMKTGNDTLDLVLMEKSLLCQKYGIKLSCMADGKCLDFMPAADLYSLFGNALDNAIEAVSTAEEEKRVISLWAARRQKMLLIHMDNYCGAELTFTDGLPVTTKEDQRFHGFGTRSIQYIVHRYGGELTMGWKDDRFDLDIMFPVTQ